MIILIDAYNVLKQSSSAKHISDAQRDAFIKKLSRYADMKGHSIIVVFDAGESSRPFEEKRGLIRVIYSGHTMDADTVLKRLCDQFQGLQVVMVSSDREVCSYANVRRIVCIEATALFELLHDIDQKEQQVYSAKQVGVAHKRSGHESSAELDQLMHESTQNMLFKPEDDLANNQRRVPAKTPSKIEKKIKKLVNKL
jgi:predicted RNA-binding protein with PIN domain